MLAEGLLDPDLLMNFEGFPEIGEPELVFLKKGEESKPEVEGLRDFCCCSTGSLTSSEGTFHD